VYVTKRTLNINSSWSLTWKFLSTCRNETNESYKRKKNVPYACMHITFIQNMWLNYHKLINTEETILNHCSHKRKTTLSLTKFHSLTNKIPRKLHHGHKFHSLRQKFHTFTGLQKFHSPHCSLTNSLTFTEWRSPRLLYSLLLMVRPMSMLLC
jgi:hypothetical protein